MRITQRTKRLLSTTLLLCLTVPMGACSAHATESTAELAPHTVQTPSTKEPSEEEPPMEIPPMEDPSISDPTQMRTLSRLGFIQLLAAASGESTDSYGESPFTDVNDHAVNWAYAKWLVTGNNAHWFRPNSAITRQQAAAILGRYLDYKYTTLPPGCGTGAPRMNNVAEWAQDGVMKCWMYGIIDTGDKPDFVPNGFITGVYGKEIIDKATHLGNMEMNSKAETPTFTDSLVRVAQPEGNFMLSPYSARLCLAMLANGAKGETQEQLLSALQIDDLAAFNAQVKRQLATYDNYQQMMALNIANSLWLNQSWFNNKGAFLPAFRASMQDAFRAEVKEVTTENSVEQVNTWVKEKTKDKIPSILNESNRRFVTALVNAVYFKAAWTNEFSDYLTDKAPFTNADGSTAEVDMMHQIDSFGYYSTPGVEALRMNYNKRANLGETDSAEDGKSADSSGSFDFSGDGELCGLPTADSMEKIRNADFSMYLIKAGKDFDVQHFLNQIEFVGQKVRVSVPKFKLEYGQSLDAALQALGATTVYDDENADLSAMVDTTTLPDAQLFLDTVLQKTYIAIDEKGTEAAAVTAGIGATATAMPDRPPLVRVFTADSPFWFAIRDNTSKEILFVGRYETAQ